MKLIVGLGNPGRKYEQTRHNVGFMVAAKLAALISAGPSKIKFEGEWAEGIRDGETLGILCPHTFMNASGQSVRKAIDFYKLSSSDLLVICDDLNLPSGRLRLRPSGSAGGQKGLADIIRHLGTESFARLRIGIGRPPQQWMVTDYVLGKLSGDEKERYDTATTQAAYAAIDWATKGIVFAMNAHNADPNAGKPEQKTADTDLPNQNETPDSRANQPKNSKPTTET